MLTTTAVLMVLTYTLPVLAKDIHINVAPNNQPTIEPSPSQAEVDDVLIFHFPSSGSHSIVQGTFESPCQPVDGGFYSGIIDGGASPGTTFAVRVETTDTLWFFGGEGRMCGRGMVGVVNAFSEGGPTLDDWRTISRDTATGAVNVPAGHGGVLGKSDTPPIFPSSSSTPPEPPKETRTITATTVTSSTVVTTTTDASGKQYVTSYGTAVGTGTSVVTTTVEGGGGNGTRSANASASVSGSVRLVPSFDAGAAGLRGEGGMGREGVVLGVVGVLVGLV